MPKAFTKIAKNTNKRSNCQTSSFAIQQYKFKTCTKIILDYLFPWLLPKHTLKGILNLISQTQCFRSRVSEEGWETPVADFDQLLGSFSYYKVMQVFTATGLFAGQHNTKLHSLQIIK